MSDHDEMMAAVNLVLERHVGRVNCKCSDDSYCPKWSLCVAGCGEWPCDAYDLAVIAKESLAPVVEPPVLSRAVLNEICDEVFKAANYRWRTHAAVVMCEKFRDAILGTYIHVTPARRVR